VSAYRLADDPSPVPADYAGGDFYDWLRTPDGSVVLALGDLSGHCVGPVLVAAECRAYWRSLAQSLALGDAVLRLNERCLADLAPGVVDSCPIPGVRGD
jgi:hypothetical protein